MKLQLKRISQVAVLQRLKPHMAIPKTQGHYPCPTGAQLFISFPTKRSGRAHDHGIVMTIPNDLYRPPIYGPACDLLRPGPTNERRLYVMNGGPELEGVVSMATSVCPSPMCHVLHLCLLDTHRTSARCGALYEQAFCSTSLSLRCSRAAVPLGSGDPDRHRHRGPLSTFAVDALSRVIGE